MFSIRRTLIGLFLLLGLGLCILVALQAWTTFLQYRDARELTASNSAREELSRAVMALAEERTEAYLSLLGGAPPERTAAEARQATDAVFKEAAETLARVGDEASETALERLRQTLEALRETSDARRSMSSAIIRAAEAPELLAGYSQIVKDLVSLRVVLLMQEHSADGGTANAFQMRRYATVLLEALSLNEALIGGLQVKRTPEAERDAWDQIRGNSERAELAHEFLENRSRGTGRTVLLTLTSLRVAYEERYRPLEQQFLAALDGSEAEQEKARREAYPLLWSTRQIARTGAEFQESLFTYSRDQLERQQRQAALQALLWASMLLLGLAAVARGTWVVIRRVVRPLDHLRRSMMALAEGDLNAPLPLRGRDDEIGAMADALRVFKANAIRRARLQEERLALHEKLQTAHQQLEKDLEAASAVQLSLLPAPARLGGVRFAGRLRPSHFISGDTYDVLRQPNGPVHFFLADVAGHGAAAALVSVASRYAAAQAILQRRAGDCLAQTIATLNDDWPEHLPYFTVIMGELRPEEGRGCLVQAGHPPPVLLGKSGQVEMIGEGGLPIGVIRQAAFDEVTFGFEAGDRLLVYSDGLTEAEDPAGQPFTEERLLHLLRANLGLSTDALLAKISRAVQEWCGSETMEDDMTLLVLEGAHGEDEAWPIAAE